MDPFIAYILKTITCGGVFYLLYHWVFDGRTNYVFCRWYLLLSVAASALIPVMKIHVLPAQASGTAYPGVTETVPLVETIENADIAQTAVSALPYHFIIYILVCFFFLSGIVIQLIRVRKYKHGASVLTTVKATIYQSGKIKTPFTLFRNVFIPAGIPEQEWDQIVTHELSHASHNHSRELLIMEVMKSLMWINPFVWLSRKALEQVQEYEADHAVISKGHDMYEYKTLLFRLLVGYSPDISNGLSCERTKKRFIMMNKNKPHGRTLIRATAVIPAIAVLLLVFCCTSKNAAPQTEAETTEGSTTVSEVKFTRDESQKILVHVDGKPVSAEYLDSIDPDEIESISIYKDDESLASLNKAEYDSFIDVKLKEKEEPFVVVENMPAFQGGDLSKFREWVQNQVVYPPQALEEKINGKVVVTFVVEKDGKLGDIRILSSPDQLLSDEVVRALKTSPLWTPGTQRNQKVRVRFNLPVDFEAS